jgi:NADP-dependent 3-hydroxy acid dehydrogenase YdfG
MSDLRYRIVLITGGSGGLGQALAAAFLREETRVVIAARDHDRLNAAAEKIAQNSTQVLALPCEISQRIRYNVSAKRSKRAGAKCRF